MIRWEELSRTLRNTWLHPRYIGTVHMHPLVKAASAYASGTLIDVGCGLRPYEALFSDRTTHYIGMDVFGNGQRQVMDVAGDALALPFKCECADTILATEVIEHVSEPDVFLSEVKRVLRVGGILVLSAPFLEPIHEEPRDFFRFTPYGLQALLARHGFSVHSISPRGGWWSVVVGSFVNQTLYEWASPLQSTGRRTRTFWSGLVLPICACCQIAGYVLDRLFRSRRYSLGYLVVARREQPDLSV